MQYCAVALQFAKVVSYILNLVDKKFVFIIDNDKVSLCLSKPLDFIPIIENLCAIFCGVVVR